MPKIIDAFTFFNENDVAAIRFEELDPVVDQFIIVQAGTDFRGRPKPDLFDWERFKEYKHKIHSVWKHSLPGKTTWEREIYQRNLITDTVKHNAKEDTLIISDVDEIPRRSVVCRVDEEYRLLLDKYSYAINMLTDEGNSAARILPVGAIEGRTAEEIRRGHGGILVNEAGWEFSSLGTPEEIYTKLTSFAHDEFDHIISPEFLAKQISQGRDLLDRDIGMTLVEVDDTWPEAVKNDRTYWAKYELYLEGDSKCYPLGL